ncbi:MAG: hypothetical protein ABIO24_00425, partial [Saprospiraceae bacterium]
AEITQAGFLKKMVPLLQKDGRQYRKTQAVLARKAVEGERISTFTKDGLETTNIADPDDYVVQNQTDTGEQYIVDTQAFEKKYTLSKDLGGDYDQYQPVNPIFAIELTTDLLKDLQLTQEFHFIAAWGEPMRACQGDFLASPPDFSEIYRVARHEFFQTYSPV